MVHAQRHIASNSGVAPRFGLVGLCSLPVGQVEFQVLGPLGFSLNR